MIFPGFSGWNPEPGIPVETPLEKDHLVHCNILVDLEGVLRTKIFDICVLNCVTRSCPKKSQMGHR